MALYGHDTPYFIREIGKTPGPDSLALNINKVASKKNARVIAVWWDGEAKTTRVLFKVREG